MRCVSVLWPAGPIPQSLPKAEKEKRRNKHARGRLPLRALLRANMCASRSVVGLVSNRACHGESEFEFEPGASQGYSWDVQLCALLGAPWRVSICHSTLGVPYENWVWR